MKEGKVAYIEGNRDHPVNKGVLCAKGSAGIMQVNAPSRLRSPLKRVGERGSGEFEEISWDEALEIASSRLAKVRADDPSKLAFFTGRDQSQSFTSFWAQGFGTPNYAAHGGFCSGIWLRLVSTQWGVHFGNLDSLIGIIPKCLCSSVWLRIMTVTRLRWV